MGKYSKSTNGNMVTIIGRANMFGHKWFMLFVMSILLLWTSSCDSKIEILNGENQVRQYLLDEEGIEDENIVRIFNIEEDYFYILESASLKNTYYLVHFVKIDDEKFRYYDESAKLSIEGMEEGNLAKTNAGNVGKWV